MPIVHGDESRGAIGDASVLLVRLGDAEPVRHRRQELGAGRAASPLKPHEPHPATIPHQPTTPGIILALARHTKLRP